MKTNDHAHGAGLATPELAHHDHVDLAPLGTAAACAVVTPTSDATPTPGKGGRAAKGNTSTANSMAKPQAHTLALVQTKGEPRMDSRALAYSLGVQHKATMNQILKYREALERFNQLSFQKSVGERKQGGGKAEHVAFLTEEQAVFMLTLSRNTNRVIDLKVKLVQVFSEARRNAHLRQTEYLPEYHALHNQVAELARGSQHQRHVHTNINRLVNKVAGIESGQRSRAPMSILSTVQAVAAQAMTGAVDHRDGYQRAKAALQHLAVLLPLAGVQALGEVKHGN